MNKKLNINQYIFVSIHKIRMGAASSISSISSDTKYIYNVYISYDYTLQYNCLQTMCLSIEQLGINIITSDVTKLCDKNYDANYITNNITETMKTCKYLIICVSNSTIKSFIQTIELNIALDYRDKIIYIITEKESNTIDPIIDSIIGSVIKDNKWFRCYDESTFAHCLNEIMYILDSN